MKTVEQIEEARKAVTLTFVRGNPSPEQRAILTGMSVALCWVADAGGITLERLVQGEKFAYGKTVEDAGQQVQDFFQHGKLSEGVSDV